MQLAFRKRLAEMLNYFLAQITSSKFKDLLFSNKSLKKIFKPEEILSKLMLIYLNLSVYILVKYLKKIKLA